MRLERETPKVSATAFIANRPSAIRSAAIAVFLSLLWKGLRGGFRPPSSCDRACAPAPGHDPPISSLPNSRQPLVRIHGCSISLAQEPAPPIKQIGRDGMTASGRRYRLAGFETLLNDCASFCSVVHRLRRTSPVSNSTCRYSLDISLSSSLRLSLSAYADCPVEMAAVQYFGCGGRIRPVRRVIDTQSITILLTLQVMSLMK